MIISRPVRYAVTCLVCIVLLASVTPLPLRADGEPCLFMLKDGNLVAWCEGKDGLESLTSDGHSRRPVMSPDGTYIAYSSMAPETVSALNALGYADDFGPDDWPSNMWVMNLDQRQPEQITAQPADIHFNDVIPSNAVSRSNPTWSPDGQIIAWTEIIFGAETTSLASLTYRLVTYNIATKTTQIIVPELPKPFQKEDTLRTIRVLWGAGGIALAISRQPPMRELYIFDQNGQQIMLAPLGRENFYDFLWVNDSGKDYVGIMYATKAWVLIDPANGQAQPMNGTPELYSTQVDNYATFITIKMNGAQIAGLEWQAAEKSVSKIERIMFPGETNFAHRITVSAGGIAFVSDAVYVWREDGLKRIQGTDNIARGWEDAEAGALAWGATAWRVRR
jgi:hypothetical protein